MGPANHPAQRTGPNASRYRDREPPLILYLDASALVKLLLIETGTDELVMETAEHVSATSLITYAEACAAVAMAQRTSRLSGAESTIARQRLDARWPDLGKVEPNELLVQHAGDLAFELGLRGHDAIHLASALALAAADAVTVATWDQQLAAAAGSKGLSIFPRASAQ